MIFLAAVKPCNLKVYGTEFTLEPLSYPQVNPRHILVMEPELGRRILERDRERLQPITFDAQRLPGFPMPLCDLKEIKKPGRVLLVRGGGIGDVLMATPAIRELRKALPEGSSLTLATFRSNIPLFAGNPFIDRVIAEPMTLAEILGMDYYMEFNDQCGLMSRVHLTDFYLSALGLDPAAVEDKRPLLRVEQLQVPETVERLGKACSGFDSLVYLNGLASDRLRDLPPRVLEVFSRNHPRRLFVIPLSYRERYNGGARGLLKASNVMELDTRESLSGYVSALACCDAVVTTDSSAYHLAAALGKPCLALFGAIDPGLRTAYYPTVKVLQAHYEGKTCRSPCGKSMISEFRIPINDLEAGCPEARKKRTRFSPCLGSFSEVALMEAFEEIHAKHPQCTSGNPKPATRSPKPETRSAERGTRKSAEAQPWQ
ncbi:MAG: glycosyltransferase family 9 protein [Thermodesulfobacteriota bacterium]